MTYRQGMLIILSSPSGAGKSTLSRMLREWDSDIGFSISYTTRNPRIGEIDGQDYHFVSKDEFQKDIAAGKMLEHAEVFGNLYGSPLAPIKRAINLGRDILFDIDWKGAQQIQNSPLGPNSLSIFILPPSIAELQKRLEKRGLDKIDVIRERMKRSWDEISHWNEYAYVLINKNLEQTAEQLQNIITAERSKRSRQPELYSHVMQLQDEFEQSP
ncbi:MAG: guanylate kinase [Roseovarius sp.]|nr:guanylate kinase [Roseovarius sp.]MCY4207126.1 guanylate kinase [Roseovarius sp.]MCY4291995.1 guanylate kinase [Roseovarius sp.]MCY4316024.1 guanylate kinase [Roseovarius sp.]